MIALQVENLTKSVGDRLLFGDVTFGVNEGDKIGIIAKNGTGKTSLLRIIALKDSPDSGTVTLRSGLRIAMLDQTPEFNGDPSALDAALSTETPLGNLIREYEHAVLEGDSETTARLSSQMDAENAWDYEDRARQLLTRLNISDLRQPVSQMSGGQLKRVALCRLLLDNPDILILDEPTNHLDISTIEWLENYLSHQRTTLLMVTHDRYFLDRVCSRIIEIDRQQIFSYDGNYDYYLRRRKERIEAMGSELDKVRNLLRREQEWMSRRPQARATKAKARIDAYYDLRERSKVDLRERNINLESSKTYIGNKIFEAKGISKRFGGKVILDNFSYTFARGEKLGIVGENGVGKTTFIRMLQGLCEADSGQWNVGETVRFGYYSQDGISFDPQKKVIDAVTEIAEDIRLASGIHASPLQYLQKFLFAPPDQQKYISTLSGGERARLHLAVTLMRQPNFLILDEPTNDLDIVTLGVLEEYLRDFNGCLIVITHDRFFLDNVVDHIFVFEGNGIIKDFPGTYTEWCQWKASSQRESATHRNDAEKTPPERTRTERQRKLTFKESKELEALTSEISSLEAEKASLEEIFSGNATGNLEEASRRYSQVKDLLDEKEMRWLELSEIGQ